METLVKELAQFIKILGDTSRLSIIKAISSDSRSVTEIINLTGLSQTLVSFHLRTLRDTGVVSTRKDGPFIYYNISNLALLDILEKLSVVADLQDSFSSSRHISKQGKVLTI